MRHRQYVIHRGEAHDILVVLAELLEKSEGLGLGVLGHVGDEEFEVGCGSLSHLDVLILGKRPVHPIILLAIAMIHDKILLGGGTDIRVADGYDPGGGNLRRKSVGVLNETLDEVHDLGLVLLDAGDGQDLA